MDSDLAHRPSIESHESRLKVTQNVSIQDPLPTLHFGFLVVVILPNPERNVQITLAARLAALDGDAKIREGGGRVNYFRQH